jgi:ATP-dependent protease HslVU (ClpYQ) ATPase subunit
MTDLQTVKALARAYTRETMAKTPNFGSLPFEDQRILFTEMYNTRFNDLAKSAGLPVAVSQTMAEAKKASDLIDEERHKNERIEQAGELAGEFIDEVDFPGFVKDLPTGVFDANLKVTLV